MSAPLLPRLALRQSRFLIQRRAASTTSATTEAAAQGAAKAKDAAQETASKATQGLSKVTSSANSAVSKYAASAGNALSGIGGRTGQLISFVQGLIPPTIYYSRVVGELGKAVYNGRGMQPPTVQTVQSYLTPLTNVVRNPSALVSRSATAAENTATAAVNNPQSFLTRLRNLDTATLTTVGVITAETIGFFSIGEIIGRFKLVGYRSSAAHGHH